MDKSFRGKSAPAGHGGAVRWGAGGSAFVLVLCGSVGAHAQSAASFPDVQAEPAPPAATTPAQAPQAIPATPPQQGTDAMWPPPSSPPPYLPESRPNVPVAPYPAWPPAVLPYRKGQPVPEGYRLEETAATGLVVGGAVTFMIAYAGGIALAAREGFENGTGWMLAPVIGPWASLAAREHPCSSVVGSDLLEGRRIVDQACINDAVGEAFTLVLMTIDGLMQATGATLFFIGLSTRERQLVRKDVALLRVAPRITPGRLGLDVGGTF